MNLREGGAPLPQKNTVFPPDISEAKRARGLVGTLQELNYKVEKTIKVAIEGHLNKKRVKKTIIEEVPKGIKAILAERGCLLISKKCPVTKCSGEAKKNYNPILS
ncbi:hypothetical protein ACEPPN_008594 [Leptodophora sp. 'Broadleaf-Isolate-01']